jgi:hypothetical protein
MIDWLADFDRSFSQYPEIQKLKADKFHGAVEINFCDGIPQNYNLKLHRRAEDYQPLKKEMV